MFFLPRLYRHPTFVVGMREVSPQAPGHHPGTVAFLDAGHVARGARTVTHVIPDKDLRPIFGSRLD